MKNAMPDVATIEDRVASCIDSHGLLEGVRRLGLAVSGGSDSIALLHLMAPICKRKGILTFVLNLDHGVPGEHSDEDAIFVKGVAASLGLPFVGGVASGIRGGEGESFEMAARKARHVFFRDKFKEFALDALATGHQADDVAETFLLRLMRGSGPDGLAGMKPTSDGATGEIRVIRPLVGVGRDELRQWLRGRGLGWREDPSNADTSIQRNGIRQIVIPAMERLAGHQVRGAIVQSLEIIREEDRYLDNVAHGVLSSLQDGDALPVRRLCDAYPLAVSRRVVRLWLLANFGSDAAGFNSVASIIAMCEGTTITFPGGAVIAMLDGVARHVHKTVCQQAPPEAAIGVGASVSWGAYTISTSPATVINRSSQHPGRWPALCTVSLDRLGGKPLIVRGRRPGDRIAPIGLDGSKSLQDVFVDAKVPASERNAYPVFECDGNIVWLPGYRVSRDFAVRNGDAMLSLSVTREMANGTGCNVA